MGPHRNIVITVGTEKLERCGYRMVKKMFTRFERVHERDRQTDGRTDKQTLRDGIGRAYAYHRAAKIVQLQQ